MMRFAFPAAIALGLLVGAVIAGVRLLGSDDGDPRAADPGATQASASPAPKPGTPLETATRFASAWMDDDFDSMYLLLSPASQQAVSLETFTSDYRSFAYELTGRGLNVRASADGDAGARLDVKLETAYFGPFEYTTLLRLEKVNERWFVAWETADIHPSLVPGLRFKSTIERPTRGSILDYDGNILAETKDIRMLGLNRALVRDRAGLAARLVAFGFAQADVDAAFNSSLGPQQRVAVGAIPEAKTEQAIAELRDQPGVLFYFETLRLHPLGESAAHVVGYTREFTAEELAKRPGQGLRAGDRVGATGLEATLDETLAGRAGLDLSIVDEAGAKVETLVTAKFVEGVDVYTTLDAAVLVAAQKRLGARAGAAVVIDPRTNHIFAINSSPSFDPNAFERGDSAAINAITSRDDSPLTDRATGGLYSAGSVFKLVTGAAGLASGGYTPSDTIFCGATWNGVDPPRKNWEGAQGPLTIAQGLMRSCNPVFYEIALKLYNTTEGALSDMARAFGFGVATGTVGLDDEDGLVPDAEWKKRTSGDLWFPGDEVNLGIGQGDLLITPLQLANAYSSFIARNLRVPVILRDHEATVRGAIPLSDAQFAHLQRGLELVTGPSGTANTAFWNLGYTNFAGKSGTAEDTGAQQHVLFVAFAPASAPQAVVAVVLDDGQSGSLEAGPIARDIVLAALD